MKKMQKKMLCLAVLGAAVGLAAPMSAMAGTVGYHNLCTDWSGDITGVAAAAGHTKVDVATIDAGSLTGLSALVITTCSGGPQLAPNAALNTAVTNGMGLLVERLLTPHAFDSSVLPGSPTFGPAHVQMRPLWNDNVDIAAGAPIASGPGGNLDNTSLDYVSGPTYYNMVHFYPAASLPAGAIPFLTTPDPTQVGSFGYTYGTGRVVFSDSQFTLMLPGGEGDGQGTNWGPAGATFLTNALAWATGYNPGPTTTCASEGYTYTKLEWCKNICERGYTGSTLAMWIRRWTDRYRTLPYCAVEAK